MGTPPTWPAGGETQPCLLSAGTSLPLQPLLSLSLCVCSMGDSNCPGWVGGPGGQHSRDRLGMLTRLWGPQTLPGGAGGPALGSGWPGAWVSGSPGWRRARVHHPSPCRSLSAGRLTDLLLKAAFGTQAPDSGSVDSLQEKPMETGAWGAAGEHSGKWGRPRQEDPEPLLLLSQGRLLASEGTCTREPVRGAPAALPPWCSRWARPPAGPRRPRAPVPPCSQVRTVAGLAAAADQRPAPSVRKREGPSL